MVLRMSSGGICFLGREGVECLDFGEKEEELDEILMRRKEERTWFK